MKHIITKNAVLKQSHLLNDRIAIYKALIKHKSLNRKEQLISLNIIIKEAKKFFGLTKRIEKQDITSYFSNFINFIKKQLKSVKLDEYITWTSLSKASHKYNC
jgi:hypothetical protein